LLSSLRWRVPSQVCPPIYRMEALVKFGSGRLRLVASRISDWKMWHPWGKSWGMEQGGIPSSVIRIVAIYIYSYIQIKRLFLFWELQVLSSLGGASGSKNQFWTIILLPKTGVQPQSSQQNEVTKDGKGRLGLNFEPAVFVRNKNRPAQKPNNMTTSPGMQEDWDSTWYLPNLMVIVAFW
jgi:hypothetical protein